MRTCASMVRVPVWWLLNVAPFPVHRVCVLRPQQFGEQEPGTPEEIKHFVVSQYGASFPLLGKLDVNGDDAHPMFEWLKEETEHGEVVWNFTKWLVRISHLFSKRIC
jgi:glutathione peroxidase-family protein